MCDLGVGSVDHQNFANNIIQPASGTTNPSPALLTASGGSKSGSRNLAKVQRAQWDDFLSRFSPIEEKLLAKYSSATDKSDAVTKAGQTMSTAMDKSKQQTDRKLSRYGLQMSPEQTQRRDKKHSITKAANVAGAKNAMRIAKDDQKMGMMTGGFSSITEERSA